MSIWDVPDLSTRPWALRTLGTRDKSDTPQVDMIQIELNTITICERANEKALSHCYEKVQNIKTAINSKFSVLVLFDKLLI